MEGSPLEEWFWILLAVYNGLVFGVYLLDKRRAARHRWRIPEATLLWLALPGGAAGALLAMYGVQHKTRKLAFRLGVPLMFAGQAALLLWAAGRLHLQ